MTYTREINIDIAHVDPSRSYVGQSVTMELLSENAVSVTDELMVIGTWTQALDANGQCQFFAPVPDDEKEGFVFRFIWPNGDTLPARGSSQVLSIGRGDAMSVADIVNSLGLAPTSSLIVTTPNIQDGAVTLAKLASEVYSQGSWTPSLSCLSPGDLSVNTSLAAGYYVKIGAMVQAWWKFTGQVTYTTASSLVTINGFPFASLPQTTANQFGQMHQTGGLGSSGRPVLQSLMPTAGDTFCVFYTRDLISASVTQLPINSSGTTYTLSGYIAYLTQT